MCQTETIVEWDCPCSHDAPGSQQVEVIIFPWPASSQSPSLMRYVSCPAHQSCSHSDSPQADRTRKTLSKTPMFTTKPTSTSLEWLQIHTPRHQNPCSLKNVTRYGTKWMTVVFLVPGCLSMLSWEIKAIRLGALSDLAVGRRGMWIVLEGALTYSYVCDVVSFNLFP